MAIEVFNRYELKYFLNQTQYEKLMSIIENYMNRDVYNQNGKTYKICNLYLDTENDDLISMSLDKPVYKEKLRLRSYGQAKTDDTVFLEIKKKYKGMVNKRRSPFKLSDAYLYIEKNEIPESPLINRQVLSEIDFVRSRFNVRPKVFISYDRFAFFEKEDDDFRLTLDTNILTRRTNLKLESEVYGEPLLEEGVWLMEAKAYKTFPLWFSRFLSENKVFQVSFSKYGSEYKKYLKNGCDKISDL